MIIVGIDPGVTGACAAYRDSLIEIFDMPVSGKEVDAAILARRLEEWIAAADGALRVLVEHQQAYPGQGVSTSFQTGRRFGLVLGVVAALNVPVDTVSPTKWKNATKTPKDKDGARARASQLMPESAGLWPLKKHHGRAEAALIAYYGAHMLLSTQAHRAVA